jgi:hypothetical protein
LYYERNDFAAALQCADASREDATTKKARAMRAFWIGNDWISV